MNLQKRHNGFSKKEFLATTLCSRAESLLPNAERDTLQEAQKKQLQIYWFTDKTESLDKNTDGFLSKDEAPFANFVAIDLDHDEKLSKDELLEYSMANGFPKTSVFPSPRKR